MSKDLKWHELLDAFFGVRLSGIKKGDSPCEIEVWEEELRKKRANGEEACEALRYISTLDSVPRADASRRTARYDLRDMMIWLHIYRSTRGQVTDPGKTGRAVNSNYVEGYCRMINQLIDAQDFLAAAFVAEGNPDCAYQTNGDGYAIKNDVWTRYRMAERAPTEDELISIYEHCQVRGFDYKAILSEYAEKMGIKDVTRTFTARPVGIAAEEELDDAPF